MIPLTITAHLHTPAIIKDPVLFDGVLVGGLGARLGSQEEGGWVDPQTVYAYPLPLAPVSDQGGWWYAASQATPSGPERVHHAHRRMPAEDYLRWTSAKITNFASGPDKNLRVRLHYRPAMLSIRWTCIGDPDEIKKILSWVSGIGNRVGHGFGQVARWEVTEGGPALDAYKTDVSIRHIPMSSLKGPIPRDAMIAQKRLRSPYWSRFERVPCAMIPAIWDDVATQVADLSRWSET